MLQVKRLFYVLFHASCCCCVQKEERISNELILLAPVKLWLSNLSCKLARQQLRVVTQWQEGFCAPASLSFLQLGRPLSPLRVSAEGAISKQELDV